MNNQKKDIYNRGINIRMIIYIVVILLISIVSQIFTDQVLSRCEMFWAANYDDLLVNMFMAQVTIIILPLSLFGIFTEITSEVYLGQPIAEYMYMYRSGHFLSFRYKELVIGSFILTMAEYFMMSKSLLAAELTTLVLNTVVMLASLFSWLEIRIRKEELHAFIREQLYMKIKIYTELEASDTYKRKLLSNLKDWVVNGGDYELAEAIQFYGGLYIYIGFRDMELFVQDTEKEEPAKNLWLSYKNADTFFDELVADLLRKRDYYRALRCSKGILEVIAWNRVRNYYHLSHYHYRILLDLFRNISETEMELLGDGWFCDYLVTILKYGNVKGYFALAAREGKTEDSEELQYIREEGYTLVYEFLMAVWRNGNLQAEYKQKQLENFLLSSIGDLSIINSVLCVSMKLMETKEQVIIDIVVERNWIWAGPIIGGAVSVEKEEREFYGKSMVLVLAYVYYLVAYVGRNVTIPHSVKARNSMERYHIHEVLMDCAWEYFDEIKEFLNKNYKLDGEFRQKYYDVIYDIMLFSAMANNQWSILVKNYTDGYNKVIYNFRYITGDDKLLEEAISRYEKYINLFGTKSEITDQMISDQFHEFKKRILRYYMESAKVAAEKFDKKVFWENLKEKVWKELLADQRFAVNPPNVQVSEEGIVEEAVFSWFYLVSPYEGDYDAHKIKECLCAGILQKSAGKEETGDREIARTYEVLSLEWEDEELDNERIDNLIKKEQGVKVRLNFFPLDVRNIYIMNFRTYEEAYEFAKSEYRKIVFRLTVKI